MRYVIGHLHLLLLSLCCDCLATVHLKSGTEDHNGISETTSTNGVMRPKPKAPFGRSVDDPSTTSVFAGFPCPDAEAIAPCLCTIETDNRIYLECTQVESVEQLTAVFQQEFPVKDLYRFTMTQNSAVTLFPSFMNGVTFESLYLSPGPFDLEGISDKFLLDLKDTLTEIYIGYSKLQTEFFPFYLLPLMKLQTLHLHGSYINWIPQIRTPNITYFGVDHAYVEILAQGTIPVGTKPMRIYLQVNQIHTIEPGSIFFADQNIPDSMTIYLDLSFNQLATVDEAVFGDLMPFITFLGLTDNPLTCGCDLAWLVLNEAYMGVIETGATCVDGTSLHDLDPQDYLDFCRR